METARVDIIYRPLRIGWAVDSGDFAGFREAVRFSYALWGGCYNPILTVDREAEARQLAALFRLDMIWPVSTSEKATAFAATFTHLTNHLVGDQLISNGESHVLDVRNAIEHLQSKPVWHNLVERGFRAFNWLPSDQLADVLLMLAGGFPDPAETGIDYRANALQATVGSDEDLPENSVLPATLLDHPGASAICQLGIEPHMLSRRSRAPGVYVGNASNFDDLVACWNLRAAAIPVLFVDRSCMSRYAYILPIWLRQVAEHLDRAVRTDAPEFAVWTRSDGAENITGFEGRRYHIHILDASTWGGNMVEVPVMVLGETSALGIVGKSEGGYPRVTFAYGAKAFSEDLRYHQQQLVASVSVSGGLPPSSKHLFCPPFVPELNESYGRHMVWGYDRLRSEHRSLGILINATDHDGFILALPVEDLITHVFRLAGYQAKLSSGGLILRQLINLLGGLQGGRVFKIPGVRRLIKHFGLNETFTRKTALEFIGQPDPDNPGAKFGDHVDLHIEPRPAGTKLAPHDVFGYLVENGLIRLGADLKCPRCQIATWTPLGTLAVSVTCERCGHAHRVERQLSDASWHFRISGILGAERNAQGAIPVALTLQQLDATLQGRIGTEAYSPSIELTPLTGKSGRPCEIDFVWLMGKPSYDDVRTVVILSECKDRNAIEAATMESLKEVADAFPPDRFEVYILLSKIAAFTLEEIEQVKKLNASGTPRVIMLTARELEPYFVYQRTKKEFSFVDRSHDPEGLADATVQIFLADPLPENPSGKNCHPL